MQNTKWIAKEIAMKHLGMILSLVAVIACEQVPADGTVGVNPVTGDQAACVLDIEQAMAEYDQGIADGSIDPLTAQPEECDALTEEPTLEGNPLTVNIKLTNFDDTQKAKMLGAVERIKIVINSMEFKDRVLAFTWRGQRQFNWNDGLTNEEIYDKIMLGAETLQPEVDHEMDVDVTMYYSNNSTVGYTYANTTKTWVNNKFFRNYDYSSVAANVVHEWTHKLGFGHTSSNNSDRPYTVPYGIGGIINDLIDEL
jgi:hypothetical protein